MDDPRPLDSLGLTSDEGAKEAKPIRLVMTAIPWHHRARLWLAYRLVPPGWQVTAKLTPGAWVADTARGIERMRDLARAADVIAAARAVTAAFGDDDWLARHDSVVADLRDRLEVLDHGSIGPRP